MLAAFQTFTQISVMTSGGPMDSTNVIVYSIYREFYFNGKYGLCGGAVDHALLYHAGAHHHPVRRDREKGSLRMTPSPGSPAHGCTASSSMLLLILVAVVVLFPLWSAFTISMLTDQEVASYPPRLWPSGLHLGELRSVRWSRRRCCAICLTASSSRRIVMIGQLVTASLAAYAFAFIDFKGRNIVFLDLPRPR